MFLRNLAKKCYYLSCLRRLFSATLFGIIILTISYCTPKKWAIAPKHNCEFKVCIEDTGLHINIIVSVKNRVFDWGNYLPLKSIGTDQATNYQYLSFGWGDRDFYMQTPTWEDIKLDLTFKALFLPTPSVMYVQRYQVIPANLKIKCVKVNRSDYLQLMKFINATFQGDTETGKVRIGNGHRSNGGFYAANGSYSILRNCNSWVAEGLRKADINTPVWDTLSSAIWWHFSNSCSVSTPAKKF